MNRATVQLADDSVLFRSALRVALENTEEFDVIAETADVTSTLAEVRRTGPDLVLVAADLPGEGGAISVCGRVAKDRDLPTRSLILDAAADQHQLLRALEAGAVGYVPRDVRLINLLSDMRAAIRGEATVPPRMLGGLLRELIERRRRWNDFHERYARLSPRERETLALLANGCEHVEIARTLVISSKTARTHVQNLLAKLDVHSRLEAVTLAVEHGVVDVRGGRG
jgi:two-component system nitrate/nitrite response regulator NarL